MPGTLLKLDLDHQRGVHNTTVKLNGRDVTRACPRNRSVWHMLRGTMNNDSV